jgi:hypothetical protein
MPEGPIARYLAELRREFRGNPLLARRVLEEVADHLAGAAAAARESGMSDHDAEEAAVRRFGPAPRFSHQFDRFALPLRAVLALSSLATAGMAAWLLYVIAIVLPARDPAHVPLWLGIAIAYLAWAALSWAFLVAGPRHPVLRIAGPAGAVIAMAWGLALVAGAAQAAHFEGYLLLMGVVLVVHGLAAIAYMRLALGIARRLQTN